MAENDPTTHRRSGRPTQDVAERFWKLVDRTGDGCWPWLGYCSSQGYGYFSLGRKPTPDHPLYAGRRFAHRMAWLLAYGPLAPGEQVLHRCDTPRCVRPEHLFKGTQKDNMEDMARKGRAVYLSGDANASSKLTASAVIDIREQWSRRQRGDVAALVRRLMAKYSVARLTIYDVARNVTWNGLTDVSCL